MAVQRARQRGVCRGSGGAHDAIGSHDQPRDRSSVDAARSDQVHGCSLRAEPTVRIANHEIEGTRKCSITTEHHMTRVDERMEQDVIAVGDRAIVR